VRPLGKVRISFHVTKYQVMDVAGLGCERVDGGRGVIGHDAVYLRTLVAAHARRFVVDLHLSRCDEHFQCAGLFGGCAADTLGA